MLYINSKQFRCSFFTFSSVYNKPIRSTIFDFWKGPDALAVCLAHPGIPVVFLLLGIQFNLLLSPYLCFISLLYLDLYVLGDDALIS